MCLQLSCLSNDTAYSKDDQSKMYVCNALQLCINVDFASTHQ